MIEATAASYVQGFVSNKDSDTTGERGDPIEGLLYATFVASTERADVASLAEVLNVDLRQLQEAVSIACRLGFGTRREHDCFGVEVAGACCGEALTCWCLAQLLQLAWASRRLQSM